MAFSGTPVIKLVADNLVRVTGLSLGSNQTGTIGLQENSGSPGVRLPASFKPREYKNAEHQDVALQDSIEVTAEATLDSGLGPYTVTYVKTGTTPENFLITMHVVGDGEGPSFDGIEIYIRHH